MRPLTNPETFNSVWDALKQIERIAA